MTKTKILRKDQIKDENKIRTNLYKTYLNKFKTLNRENMIQKIFK